MSKILDSILGQIEEAKAHDERLLLVIDGKCGSGKTTFAKKLGQHYKCNVFHIDDFYLPIAMQTQEVMKEPGGNINFDRFIDSVITPLSTGSSIDYQPFLCIGQTYAPTVRMEASKINIIEGTYSCHPRFRELYADMRADKSCIPENDFEYGQGCKIITLFFDIDEKNQIERLKNRVGEQRFKLFENKWIPREREYFSAYAVREYCDCSIIGTDESVILFK